MVRQDAASLSLVAFMKEDGDRAWTRCTDHHPIPRGIMLPDFVMPNRIGLPTEAAMDEEDNAILVAASIGAESQGASQSSFHP